MTDPPLDPPDRSTDVTRFFRVFRRITEAMASLLAIFFVYLQVGEREIAKVVTLTSPDLIWKFALIIYYFAWVFGSLFDIELQEDAYVNIGRRRQEHWPLASIATLAILFVVAVALFWSEGNIQRFAVVLCIFVFVDHAAWRYLIKFSRPAKKASEEFYREKRDFVALEKLNIIMYQIQGPWKWWRLCAGIPLTALIVGFAFSEPIRSFINKAALNFIPGLADTDVIPFMSGLLVLIFVLAVEAWHWTMRIYTKCSLRLLDKLDGKYEFRPKIPT
jgi:hypothetical protein